MLIRHDIVCENTSKESCLLSTPRSVIDFPSIVPKILANAHTDNFMLKFVFAINACVDN